MLDAVLQCYIGLGPSPLLLQQVHISLCSDALLSNAQLIAAAKLPLVSNKSGGLSDKLTVIYLCVNVFEKWRMHSFSFLLKICVLVNCCLMLSQSKDDINCRLCCREYTRLSSERREYTRLFSERREYLNLYEIIFVRRVYIYLCLALDLHLNRSKKSAKIQLKKSAKQI